MNTGQRLVVISGLGSGTAAQHLIAAAGASGQTAGALLVLWSKLGTNTAMTHLLADGAPATPGVGLVWMRRRRR